MEVSSDLVQQLMEIGYLAIGSGQTAEAETIFSGIVAVRSESELPLIGLGVAQLSAGKAGDAVKTLGERALGMAPESDLVKSFLGLALHQTGFSEECRTLLQEVIASNTNPDAVTMAQSLLDENTPN